MVAPEGRSHEGELDKNMIRRFLIFSLASGLFVGSLVKVHAQVGEEILVPAAALCPETGVTCVVIGVVVVGGVTHYVLEHDGQRTVRNSLGRVVHNSEDILRRIGRGLLRIEEHQDPSQDLPEDFIVTTDRNYAQRECNRRAARLSRPGAVFKGQITPGKYSGKYGFLCTLVLVRR